MDTTTLTPTEIITITAWVDPIIDEHGHHPRSNYVEQWWLPTVGPTAVLAYRRITDRLAAQPHGVEINLNDLARQMGMAFRPGRNSAFANALNRLTMFGLSHRTADGYAVLRRAPQVAERHLRRLDDDLQQLHRDFVASIGTLDEFNRTHNIGLAMHHAGDSPDRIEHQLVAIGITVTVAAAIAANAAQLAAETNR